nr:hypothetical protein [uncultured Flavobacterium sp.]
MLGNKLILNKLKQNQGFVNFPFAYLSQHQENLSEIWKSFQQKIDQLTPEQLDQVINGSKQEYSLFSI